MSSSFSSFSLLNRGGADKEADGVCLGAVENSGDPEVLSTAVVQLPTNGDSGISDTNRSLEKWTSCGTIVAVSTVTVCQEE